MITCAPPKEMGARGPFSAIQKSSALDSDHSSSFLISSAVRRLPDPATPWRTLWLSFVIRNISARATGQYLHNDENMAFPEW